MASGQNSHSKASLFLIELIISLFFFSLAGVVCVRLFLYAHKVSTESRRETLAVQVSQNAAECFIAADGDEAEFLRLYDLTLSSGGSAGDALGYAMRGGEILVGGSVGYRCGIHMKAYQERQPLIVIGGSAGSFLGEYQAGGTIVVLGMHASGSLVGPCCARGMYGGTIFLAGDKPEDLPDKVLHRDATSEDMEHISRLIEPYCHRFRLDKESLLAHHFSVLEPNSSNPYRQLYTYA